MSAHGSAQTTRSPNIRQAQWALRKEQARLLAAHVSTCKQHTISSFHMGASSCLQQAIVNLEEAPALSQEILQGRAQASGAQASACRCLRHSRAGGPQACA